MDGKTRDRGGSGVQKEIIEVLAEAAPDDDVRRVGDECGGSADVGGKDLRDEEALAAQAVGAAVSIARRRYRSRHVLSGVPRQR